MSGDAMHFEVEERRSPRSDRKAPATNDGGLAGAAGAQVPGGLDWRAFTAAYFPGRRRHDLEALTCYSAYKRSRDAVSETGRAATGATAVRKWEDEGGATLPPDGP